MECKKGFYLRIVPGPVGGSDDCQPDERLPHNGCATVVSYGPVSLLADGSIRVTTGDMAVDILLDCGRDFKIQAGQDVILHPGSGRKVKVYGDLEVYGDLTYKSPGEIPEKENPLANES